MSSADNSDSSTDPYPIVSRRRTLTKTKKDRKSRRKQASNNEMVKQLLVFVLVLLSAFFEIAMVHPLIQNTKVFFFGNLEIGSGMKSIPDVTHQQQEQIRTHMKVYNNMMKDFKQAQKNIGDHIDTSKVIEVLSDTLPSFGEDNIGDMLFSDILKDGNFDFDYLPDTHSDLFGKHVKKITSTVVPVNDALVRLEGLNSNTTSSVRDNLKKTQDMSPFISKIIFTDTEFPIDDGKDLFDELKVLTDETVALLGTIFTSMIHVYQTHMYFYTGSITHVLGCVVRLQQDYPFLIEPLVKEAKTLIPDENNLSGMFTVTTATNEPPVKLQDAVATLKEISSSAVVQYTGDGNTKASTTSDIDIINDMLNTLKKTQEKFIKISKDKIKINKHIEELESKVEKISNTLINLIELFESKRNEEEKIGKNVDAFLTYKPFITIERSGRGTIELFFSDFYKFLFQQIVYSVSMMSFLKTLYKVKNKSLIPFPTGTSTVFFPWLKKLIGLDKSRRRTKRRGRKSQPKRTRKKKSKGKKGK